MLTEDSPEIIKLALLETKLAEVMFKQQPYIGTIWVKMLEFRSSVLNLKDAIYTLDEANTNANLHKLKVAKFKFDGAKQSMRDMICAGLVNMRRPLIGYAYEAGNKKPKPIYSEPIEHSESIAAYEKILTLLKE